MWLFIQKNFLCSPGPPGTPSLDHAGLELQDPPVSASQGLGSKTDTTTLTLETSHYLLAGRTTVRKDPSQQDVQFTGSQGAQRDEQGGQGGLTVEKAVRTGRLLWRWWAGGSEEKVVMAPAAVVVGDTYRTWVNMETLAWIPTKVEDRIWKHRRKCLQWSRKWRHHGT